MGVIDFAQTCGSEQGDDGVLAAEVGQLALVAFLTQALGARTNLLMYLVLARKRWSFSEKEWMTSACTLIISAEQYERLLATRHRVTSQHGWVTQR